MKSEWKVSSQHIGGEKMYIALRILDTSQPQHGGNVETKGTYSTDLDSVQNLVHELNGEVWVMEALTSVPGVTSSPGKYYCGVTEVMEYLGCRENKAYKLIRELRAELMEAGKLTTAYPQGKVPRKYFLERCMIEE